LRRVVPDFDQLGPCFILDLLDHGKADFHLGHLRLCDFSTFKDLTRDLYGIFFFFEALFVNLTRLVFNFLDLKLYFLLGLRIYLGDFGDFMLFYDVFEALQTGFVEFVGVWDVLHRDYLDQKILYYLIKIKSYCFQ